MALTRNRVLNQRWKNSNSSSPPSASAITVLQGHQARSSSVAPKTPAKYSFAQLDHCWQQLHLPAISLSSNGAADACVHSMQQGRQGGHLYCRGSCLRMRRTDEIAYMPVSCVRISTSDAPLPDPETAKKTCSTQWVVGAAKPRHLHVMGWSVSNTGQLTTHRCNRVREYEQPVKDDQQALEPLIKDM